MCKINHVELLDDAVFTAKHMRNAVRTRPGCAQQERTKVCLLIQHLPGGAVVDDKIPNYQTAHGVACERNGNSKLLF